MAHTVDNANVTRRDFLYVASAGMAAVGGALALWPFIDQMNPAADTRALSTTEVDLTAIPAGQQIKVMWQGKPVFVRHRTAVEIAAAGHAPARAAGLDGERPDGRADVHAHPAALERLPRERRDLVVLVRQHAVGGLDDRHVAAEAAVEARELDADRAGAHDQQR